MSYPIIVKGYLSYPRYSAPPFFAPTARRPAPERQDDATLREAAEQAQVCSRDWGAVPPIEAGCRLECPHRGTSSGPVCYD